MIEDIQTETARLETDKLDKNGELRTGNWAWKISYTDGSWNEVELALPTAWKVLTGNGATSAPTFETPTVDINGLTEVGSPFAADDYTLFYDQSGTANKKHLCKASTTNEWFVEMATDAESLTWSDETRYINPKQAKDNYGYTFVPWETVIYENASIFSWVYSSYTKAFEITAKNTGTYRISWEQSSGSSSYTCFGKVYKNDIAFGTEKLSTAQYPSFSAQTEDLAFTAWDKIQL
jgi:hypothetical protein